MKKQFEVMKYFLLKKRKGKFHSKFEEYDYLDKVLDLFLQIENFEKTNEISRFLLSGFFHPFYKYLILYYQTFQ